VIFIIGIAMFRLLLICVLCLIVSNAYADLRCDGSPEADKKSYAKAIKHVQQLSEFKKWQKSQKYPVILQAAVDKKTLISDQCYWSVTVATNEPDRLGHWQTFYVGNNKRDIMVEDIAGGEPIALTDWRLQQMNLGGSQVLPDDAAAVADRYKTCQHFAGEFNGDGSLRDKEINVTMKTLKCDKVENDAQAIRKRYAKNKKILETFERTLGEP
jgi:hypothetical protein